MNLKLKIRIYNCPVFGEAYKRYVFDKPEMYYQNTAYLNWLNNLIIKIKNVDRKRPVIVDVKLDTFSVNHVKSFIGQVPNMDVFGLNFKKETDIKSILKFLTDANINYLISDISVENLKRISSLGFKGSYFISEWQDQHTSNKLSLTGLIDRKGRLKQDYFELFQILKKVPDENYLFKSKILKPLKLTHNHSILIYKAMVLKDDAWEYGSKMEHLDYEWSLIKCDSYGNYVTIKDIGKGPTINLEIPKKYEFYRLLLTSIKDEQVVSTHVTTLNTPYILN